MNTFPDNTNRGFVILFAVLISAIVLLVGYGIFSISFKETVISSTVREANMAFYAADAGLECALMNDRKPSPNNFLSLPNGSTIRCIEGLNTTITKTNQEIRFNFPVGDGCVLIYVDKEHTTAPPSGTTLIEARGYSACQSIAQVGTTGINTPDITDPTLVERAIRARYPN